MEEPYRRNMEKMKECDIVFIAVPTPSTPKGFDYSIVESVLALVGKGKPRSLNQQYSRDDRAATEKASPYFRHPLTGVFAREDGGV